MVEIEKNIPMPAPRRGLGYTESIREMKVGDSVQLPRSAASIAYSIGKTTDRKFEIRVLDGGYCRVWRVA